MFDYMIVGAGLAGATVAERLANEGKKILVVEKRNHIAGNTFDHYNEDGILVHKYGPHIFHTNSENVFTYLSNFTKWRPYEHRVLASVDDKLVPIPINRTTINRLYDLNLDSRQIDAFFLSKAEKRNRIINSEDAVVSKVGRELYEKFFKNYTIKQWGLDPSELNASVAARIPVRSNDDDRYFTDTYQAMPLQGYTAMVQDMLQSPNIKILLNTDYKEIEQEIAYNKMIYTGPIDYFYNYRFGKLEYRSLDFEFQTLDQIFFQRTGTINYPNDKPFTRITEFKYLTGQSHPKTSIVYEYPRSDGDPYYPVPRPENDALYKKYQELSLMEDNVYFAGRLATYKYYNMDQVIAQALTLVKRLAIEEPGESQLSVA